MQKYSLQQFGRDVELAFLFFFVRDLEIVDIHRYGSLDSHFNCREKCLERDINIGIVWNVVLVFK